MNLDALQLLACVLELFTVSPIVLELCQFFEILYRFHGNVEKTGVIKRQPNFKMFLLVLALIPNANFCQPTARSERVRFFWYTLIIVIKTCLFLSKKTQF